MGPAKDSKGKQNNTSEVHFDNKHMSRSPNETLRYLFFLASDKIIFTHKADVFLFLE